MDRRTLLKTLGVAGAGGAVVTGTGAFTSVEANRNVSVTVEGDANAYLSLNDTGNANSEYLNRNSSDELEIDLTGDNGSTTGGGTGVNANAITVIEDLFKISNQGTQEVELTVTPLTFVDTDGANALAVLAVPDGEFPTSTLSTGTDETFSLVIDEFSPTDADVSIDSEISFLAEATQ